MDFLNPLITQLTNTFRSMSLGARIVSGLLIVVVVVSMAFLFNRQLATPDAFLFGGSPVNASELPNIEAAFGAANLKNYVVDGNRIRVPRGEESAYMVALAEKNALPAEFGSYMQSVLNDADIWSSSKKQQEKLKYSLQMELAQMIRKMTGIENASVIYDIKEKGGIIKEKIYSASVAVKTLNSVPLDENRVTSIRNLVAASFAGMTPEAVAVTDLTHNRTYPAGRAGEVLSGTQDPSYQTKIAYEEEWTRKIQNTLGYMPGSLVTVNVILNDQLEATERKINYDAKTVITTQQETTETNSQKSGGGPGGRPGTTSQGAVSNQGLTLAGGASGGNSISNEKEISTINNRFATPGTESTIRRAGLTPKRVSVSVGIPMSYFVKVWQQQNPAANGTEPRQPTQVELGDFVSKQTSSLTTHIAKLLPPRDIENPDRDPTGDVSVHTFQDFPTAELAGPSFADSALGWLGNHWSTLGTGFFGLVSLLMLRSLVKAIPVPEARTTTEETDATETATPAAPGEPAAVAADGSTPKKLLRRAKSGTSLRDELAEIVKEDPDTAASILKSWIGNAI